MGSSGDIRAGGAFVELGLKESMDKGIKAARKKLDGMAKSIASIGAKFLAVGGAIKGIGGVAIAEFTSLGTELLRASKRTGVSTDALQELSYVAAKAGVSHEGLERSLRGMAKSSVAAMRGGAGSASAYKQLGISVAQIKNLAPDQLFELVAEQLSKVENPTVRAGLAMKVFGRGGTALLPIMLQGAKGIEALRQKARDLGYVLSHDEVEAAAKLKGVMAELGRTFDHVTVAVGAALAPALTQILEYIQPLATRVLVWAQNNEALFQTISMIGTGIVIAGAALIGFGLAIKGVSMGLGAMGSIVSGTIAIVQGLAGALLFIVTSPIALLIAGIVGLGAYLTWIGGGFSTLGSIATTAFKGIGDALAAGDIAAAANVMWLSLKLAWKTGTHALYEIWVGFKMMFMGVWDSIGGYVTTIWDAIVGGIAKGIMWIAQTAQEIGEYVGVDLGLGDFKGANQALDQDLANAQKNAGKGKEEAANARNLQYQDDLAANDKELRAAREARDAAVMGAAEARAEFDAKPEAPAMPSISGGDIPNLAAGGKGKNHRVTGTFSSAVAARMGSVGDPMQKLVQQGDKQLKKLDDVIKAIRSGKVAVFEA